MGEKNDKKESSSKPSSDWGSPGRTEKVDLMKEAKPEKKK